MTDHPPRPKPESAVTADPGEAWVQAEEVMTEYERGVQAGKEQMQRLADEVLKRSLADELEIEALKARVEDLKARGGHAQREQSDGWAVLYLHDWDPPKEGQEHKWEPGKNVFPEVHAVYGTAQEAERVRAGMNTPDKYWVCRARLMLSDASPQKENAPAISEDDLEMLNHLASGMGFGRTYEMLRRVIAAIRFQEASEKGGS